MKLRLNRGRGTAIAFRDIEALDLHMHEHFLEVALVSRKERLKDHLALVAEISLGDVLWQILRPIPFEELIEHRFARVVREKKQGMIPQLTGKLCRDLIFGKLG